jgi:hypothetical protein
LYTENYVFSASEDALGLASGFIAVIQPIEQLDKSNIDQLDHEVRDALSLVLGVPGQDIEQLARQPDMRVVIDDASPTGQT